MMGYQVLHNHCNAPCCRALRCLTQCAVTHVATMHVVQPCHDATAAQQRFRLMQHVSSERCHLVVASTCEPLLTSRPATTPPRGAARVCSIFMASTFSSACPASTTCPSTTSTCSAPTKSVNPCPLQSMPLRLPTADALMAHASTHADSRLHPHHNHLPLPLAQISMIVALVWCSTTSAARENLHS
jgi:hypothetical protein